MKDEEFDKRMAEAKEKFKRIMNGEPLTASPTLNPGDRLTFNYDDEPGDLHITSPGCSGRPVVSTSDRARAAVVKLLVEAGAMSFMPEFDELFDQVEKIARRKK